MDSTTTTTTSVSSTTSTPPIAYPSSHIHSPVLNNNWADEVEAFFGDGIVHYPDNEPTLQPQLADFTDLELNLSDDEDMFSPLQCVSSSLVEQHLLYPLMRVRQ